MLFWLGFTIYVVASVAFFRWGDRRFAHHVRLPMQWSGSLQPNWYLARRPALVLCVALGGIGYLVLVPVQIVAATKGIDRSVTTGLSVLFAVTGLGAMALYGALLSHWDRTISPED